MRHDFSRFASFIHDLFQTTVYVVARGVQNVDNFAPSFPRYPQRYPPPLKDNDFLLFIHFS